MIATDAKGILFYNGEIVGIRTPYDSRLITEIKKAGQAHGVELTWNREAKRWEAPADKSGFDVFLSPIQFTQEAYGWSWFLPKSYIEECENREISLGGIDY